MAVRFPPSAPARILVAAALATGAAAVTGCASPGVQQKQAAGAGADQVGVTHYPAGKRPVPPNLSAPTLTGTRFALSSALGKVVVLNVWASWCEPCRSESPALARASAALSGRGVQFVGIDEQDDSRQATKFVAGTGAHYPNLLDPSGQLLSRLSLLPQAGVPSTLVLDRQGRVADRVIGPVTGPEITSLVEALLKHS